MKTIVLASALAALTLASAVAANAQAIRMGTEGAYPPFNFVNDNGEVDGFERELGDLICEVAQLDCTWVTNDWDSIIPNLVSGNYDTIIAGMSITDERDEVIDFTQAYFPPDPSSYVALAGMGDEATAGVVAVQTGTLQASYVAETGATALEFATGDETIAAVRNGEADAVFLDHGYLADFVNESGGELEFVGEDVLLGDGIGIGVRESDGDLKAKLDAAITTLKEDGRLGELLAKWFDGMSADF